MSATEKLPWYALYVHSRSEKKVHALLLERGYDAYLPLITQMKQWSDRTKKVEEPLFKSYLFVRADIRKYFDVLGLPGIVKFISFEKKAIVVPENQINAIKKYCNEHTEDDTKPEEVELHEGQLVKVVGGPMAGLIGRLAQINNKRCSLRD